MIPGEGLTTARALLAAPSAVLAWTDTDGPNISRIGTAWVEGKILTLLSDLAPHTAALRSNPHAALLFGDPTEKGDPLNSPRLSVKVIAQITDKSAHHAAFLAARPKSKLYYDFADFHLFHLTITSAFLNGGFGKALSIPPNDL